MKKSMIKHNAGYKKLKNVNLFEDFIPTDKINEGHVKRVEFGGYSCLLEFGEYANGRTAIQLVNFEDSDLVADATVNIPEYNLPKGQVIIKDYSENEGMLDALIKANIVSKPVDYAESGFIKAPVVKLLVNPKDYEVTESNDHEVAMANASLDLIIKAAVELQSKIGEDEINLPGWIQDHITNAENYIVQANKGYHKLKEDLK